MQINKQIDVTGASPKNCSVCRYRQLIARFDNDRLLSIYHKCKLYNVHLIGNNNCRECKEETNGYCCNRF